MKFLFITFSLLNFTSEYIYNNVPALDRSKSLVQLFEWKWKDIADECERFLQHTEYGGVQISPPNENIIANGRPWWERYQPVSYILVTRSGDEEDFKEMTRRCNSVGIRIYADAVFNHMAALGGTGTGGNNARSSEKFYPAVPYCMRHFHKTCVVINYNDTVNVRNCELVGLKDLNQSDEYVRNKIVAYLNYLIDLGVAGFRIDAAKHMWPSDLEAIYSRLNDLNPSYGFPNRTKPFIYQEVIDLGNEAVTKNEYKDIGAVVEFKYSYSLSEVFKGHEKLSQLENWGPQRGFIEDGTNAVVFVDNHDTQRSENVLNYKSAKQYKMASAFMLAHPYGITRIMSSYDFHDFNQGPPQDESGNIISPGISNDATCTNGYVCEHRWRQIYNMVEFRRVVSGTDINNWWSNNDQEIAFCRGSKGFIAFTNGGDLNENLQTCLPKGTYCDIISGQLHEERCTGKAISVGDDGTAFILLHAWEFDGVLAIHVKSRIANTNVSIS